MTPETAGADEPVRDPRREVTVTRGNSYRSGPLTGIACPNCHKRQLIADVIEERACPSCGTDLEVTLKVKDDA